MERDIVSLLSLHNSFLMLDYQIFKESSAATHICKFPSRYNLAYSRGASMASVQLIPLIGSILPTEIALKKNFDKNGTRR